MDGISIIAVAGTIAGFSVPTYYALSRIYFRLGNHEARLGAIEGKIDSLNGNFKKSRK
jgi:hypothetical protein